MLYAAVAEAAVSSGAGLQPQNPSNTVWAFATAGVEACATRRWRRRRWAAGRGFKPRDTRAFTTAGVAARALHAAVAEAVVGSGLRDFKPQSCPTRCGRLRQRGGARRRTRRWRSGGGQRAAGLQPSGPVQCGAGVCDGGGGGAEPNAAVAEAAVGSGLGLQPSGPVQHGGRLQAGWRRVRCMRRAEAAVGSGLRGFNPQALSNTVWALATAGVEARARYAAVAAVGSTAGLQPRDPSNTAGRLRRRGWRRALYAAVAEAAVAAGCGLQASEPVQHGVGVCDGGSGGARALRGGGGGGGGSGLRGFNQGCNMVWAFATAGGGGGACAVRGGGGGRWARAGLQPSGPVQRGVGVCDGGVEARALVRGGGGRRWAAGCVGLQAQNPSNAVWALRRRGWARALYAAVAEAAVGSGLRASSLRVVQHGVGVCDGGRRPPPLLSCCAAAISRSMSRAGGWQDEDLRQVHHAVWLKHELKTTEHHDAWPRRPRRGAATRVGVPHAPISPAAVGRHDDC